MTDSKAEGRAKSATDAQAEAKAKKERNENGMFVMQLRELAAGRLRVLNVD